MKKVLAGLLMILSTLVFACKCEGFGAIGKQFHEADFVGEIEVLKIYPNKEKGRTYLADIKTLKKYKGVEISKVEVSGLINDVRSSACETTLKPGEKYLIYLSKVDANKIISLTSQHRNKFVSEKNYVVSACTPRTFISGGNDKNLTIERQVLDFLSAYPDHLPQAFFIFKDRADPFKDIEFKTFKSPFAIFKIHVNGRSEAETIQAIRNFGSEQDEEIIKGIKENFIFLKGIFDEVRDENVFLTLFYLPENRNDDFKNVIDNVLN